MDTPVLSYGDWEIRVLDEDLLRLTLRGTEPPIDMIWCADHAVEVKELVHYLDALNEALDKGEFFICVNDTFYELTYADGEWRLRARGAFNFELVGLSTHQAMCVMLLLIYAREEDPFESDFLKAVKLMGLLPLLESAHEVRLKGTGFEAVMGWRGEELIIRPIWASFPSELRTLLSLVEAGVLEELEVSVKDPSDVEEIAAAMLMGKLDEDSFNESLLVPMRRELVKLLVEHVPHEGEVDIQEDKVIVRNAYGTWEVDLRDGDTYLNDQHICIEVERPASSMLVLPGVGELGVGKTSMEVVAALMVALRPEDVRDRRLRSQIRRAASLGGEPPEEDIGF